MIEGSLRVSEKTVQLKPRYILDKDWNRVNYVPSTRSSILPHINDRTKTRATKQEQELSKWINQIRIEIAEQAVTERFKTDDKFAYIKSEIGMNMIVPKGRIENLRFKVTLNSENGVIALDGFPKDEINEIPLIDGKITVAVDKAFKFVPVLSPVKDVVNIELKPWEFKIGGFKKIKVDFSGGSTSKPEWYFTEQSIKHDLRVALTLKAPKEFEEIVADVKAAWTYNPGIFQPSKIESDEKPIRMLI